MNFIKYFDQNLSSPKLFRVLIFFDWLIIDCESSNPLSHSYYKLTQQISLQTIWITNYPSTTPFKVVVGSNTFKNQPFCSVTCSTINNFKNFQKKQACFVCFNFLQFCLFCLVRFENVETKDAIFLSHPDKKGGIKKNSPTIFHSRFWFEKQNTKLEEN